jgi:hypothetical protein
MNSVCLPHDAAGRAFRVGIVPDLAMGVVVFLRDVPGEESKNASVAAYETVREIAGSIGEDAIVVVAAVIRKLDPFRAAVLGSIHGLLGKSKRN